MPVTNYNSVNGMTFSENQGGNQKNYMLDGLGNVSGYTDQHGTVISRYWYKPYGELVSAPTVNDPTLMFCGSWGYRITGRPISGLDIGYRHFSSQTSVWTSLDPLWPDVDAYGYCECSPMNSVDPTGLDWIEYDGTIINWWGGSYPSRADLKFSSAGTSGSGPYQNERYKTLKGPNTGPGWGGPVPPDHYYIDLRPYPRYASIPAGYTANAPGITFVKGIPAWGLWRARLEPESGHYKFGRDSCYLHDSDKGETHGCIECDLGSSLPLLDALVDYRKHHDRIPVWVHYTQGGSTRGKTGGSTGLLPAAVRALEEMQLTIRIDEIVSADPRRRPGGPGRLGQRRRRRHGEPRS